MAGESWLTAAIPVNNPYCSCKLIRVRLCCSGSGSHKLVRSASAVAAEQERARARAALQTAAALESQTRADDAELLQVNEAISVARKPGTGRYVPSVTTFWN